MKHQLSIGDVVKVWWNDARDFRHAKRKFLAKLKPCLWWTIGQVHEWDGSVLKLVNSFSDDDDHDGVLIPEPWIEKVEILQKGENETGK